MQEAAFTDPADNKRKMWSESNVSEDFDMALRLMMQGYLIRWVTYSKGGFKEGVSLTADDELNRWQKYAYGESAACRPDERCIDFAGFPRLFRAYFQSAVPMALQRPHHRPTPQIRMERCSLAL